MKQLFAKVLFDDSVTYRVVRLTSVAGSVTAIVGVADRFFPGQLPAGRLGLLIFALVVACGFLGLELVNAQKEIRDRKSQLTGDARADFAASLVAYASSLSSSSPPRDQALLELRRWCSRLLHLNGSHKERAQIGRLALGAAAALHDKFTEASILIDDLGWGLYVQGRASEGNEGVSEGIAVIENMPEAERNRPEVIDLLIKARRHLLTIQFTNDRAIDVALQGVRALSDEAAALPQPAQALHIAQLGHTEAALIHQYLDTMLGPQGQVDPTGRLHDLYQRAIDCSRSAESCFAELGDIERQLKALKMHVELLRHGPPSTRLHTAESRLRRLETIASRHLS